MDFELLLQQIPDPVLRENFRRIKFSIQDLKDGQTTITNTVNVVSSTANVWVKFDNSIPASTTKVIDQVTLASFTSVKYILSLFSASNNLTKYYEVGIIKLGTNVNHSIGKRLGTGMSLALDANVVSGNLELSVTNNEAYSVGLSAAKLIL